jgi:hypothetical protein
MSHFALPNHFVAAAPYQQQLLWSTKSYSSTIFTVVGRQGCENFAKGDCKRGQACNLAHHYKLDPARREDNDVDLLKEEGIACLRCIQQLKQASLLPRGCLQC